MFKKLRQVFRDFSQTIRAGYYKPATLIDHADADAGADSKVYLPKKGEVGAGLALLAGAYAVMTDVFLNVVEALSLPAVTLGGGIIAAAGIVSLAIIHHRCKKTCREKVSEINARGQTVRGERQDLYTLRQAQNKIVSLVESFNGVSAPQIVDRDIIQVIESTKDARQRVKVIDGGPEHLDKEYSFKRPVVLWVDATIPIGEAHITLSEDPCRNHHHALKK